SAALPASRLAIPTGPLRRRSRLRKRRRHKQLLPASQRYRPQHAYTCCGAVVSGHRNFTRRRARMKIALFCPAVSGRGGTESAIKNLMAGFHSLGDDCRLFLLGGSLDRGWLDGITYTAIGTPEDPRPLRLARYATQPAIELSRWKPDALIAADVTTIRM